jgi:hypothetical protein
MITGVGCSAGEPCLALVPHVTVDRAIADGPVLEQLFYTVMDEGEAVLLAAP